MQPFVLIIDGIWRKPGRFGRWRDELRERGVESVEWAYDSSGKVGIDTLGKALAQEMQSMRRPVRLLGFSMGGLIARTAHHLAPSLPIERAAFLNTPHQGTWMAHALPLTAVRQMRPNSPLLKTLNETTWSIPALAVHCVGDAMVVPGTRAKFAKAKPSICSYVPAHLWPVYSRSIRRQVIHFLSKPMSC